MNWEQFFNSLSPEQQALITAQLAASTAPLQASLTAAQAQITQMQAATPAVAEAISLDAITAELSPEAKAQVEALLQTAQEQQAQLQAIQEEQKYNAFLGELSDFGALPLDDESKKALYSVANSSPDNYSHVKALLKVADTAMSGQFIPAGDDKGRQVENTAYGKMESLVAQKMKDNDMMTYAEAMQNVARENPALWDAYRTEVATQ